MNTPTSKANVYLSISIAVFISFAKLYSQSRLFFSDSDFRTPHDLLRSSTLTGADIKILAENQGAPLDIEIDEPGGKIYWINSFDGTRNSIKRANLDGSDIEVIVSDLNGVTDMALDLKNSKIYWSYRSGGVIKSANLDGSQQKTVLSNLTAVSWIDVTPNDNKIYWLQNQSGKFMRANLNGGSKETLFTISCTNCMMSIHVDSTNDRIYWLNMADKKIQSADLNGSNVKDITTVYTGVYTYTYMDFRLDIKNGGLYWAEDNRIYRCNMDGTNKSLVVNTDQGNYSLALALQKGKICWTNSHNDRIYSCNVDGSGKEILLLNNVYREGYAVAIDYKNNNLFWSGQDGIVGRCKLDGSENVQIINALIFPQGDIALDVYEQKIYWTNVQADKIQRANFDGTNIEVLLQKANGIDNACGIALDVSNKKMYWTKNSQIGKILMANMDGSNMQEVISTGIEYPNFLKLDLKNGKMYWTSGSNKISRSNMDGTNIQDLVTKSLSGPGAFALDSKAGKMYWAETGTYENPVGRIRVANMDGTGMTNVLTNNIIRCQGLALLVSPDSPVPRLPEDGASLTSNSSMLTWFVSEKAATYKIQISDKIDFKIITHETSNIQDYNYKITNLPEGKYFWRVSAANAVGISDFSSAKSFIVPAKPLVPILKSPTDNAVSVQTDPTFVWRFTNLADSYGIQVSTSPEFSALVSEKTGIADTLYTLSGLSSNTRYFWHVNSTNSAGTSDWSSTRSFTTNGPQLKADFSGSPMQGHAPLTVQFIDSSTGEINQRLWDFADGGTSALTNPNHLYSQPGVYSVKLTITGPGGSSVKIRNNYITVLKPMESRNIVLAAGWNLISWNVDTANDSTTALLKDIKSNVIIVLAYEGGGQTYDPKLPGLSTLPSMDHLHGYWIKMTSSDTLCLSGNTVNNATTGISCEAGWNLVSYLPLKPDSASHGLSSVMNNLTVALGYHATGLTFVPQLRSFSTLKVLVPHSGYWLKLNQAVDLFYPEPLPGITPPMIAMPMVARFNGAASGNISAFINPSNEWIDLYGQNIVRNGTLLAVGTEVLAKDAQGTTCGTFVVKQAGVFGFMPVYRDDPATEIDEGCRPGETINLYFDNERIPIDLRWTEMGDVINVAEKITAIESNQSNAPTRFALLQNYPNPFNPQTTIAFQLQRDTQVTLKVFNMLGQEVVTLLNQEMQAGNHQVMWDGQDEQGKVVGGIYLYSLQAGEFKETRKMLLLY